MNTNTRTERYFGELRKLSNGTFKLFKIKKLVSINQYRRQWESCDSREIARKLNKAKLVIK